MADGYRKGRFGVIVALARSALMWENLWPRLWPVVAVAGFFISLAFLDLLPALPGWLHALVLLLFAAGLAVALYGVKAGIGGIDIGQARHRVEMDSGLEHRPLTALQDPLAAGHGDAAAVGLWQVHIRRMNEAARKLRVRLPAPGLAGHDPMGIRAAVFLFFLIALVAASGDAAGRLERAFIPQFGAGPNGPPLFEVWITPPAYTNRPPLFLSSSPSSTGGSSSGGSSSGTAIIPEGSALLARADGTSSAPRLEVGDDSVDFKELQAPGAGEAAGRRSFRAEAEIKSGTRLAVVIKGRTLAEWPMEVIADTPPEIVFIAPPARTARSRLRIQYQADDDYGLAEARAVIWRSGDTAEEDQRETIELSLPLPRTRRPGKTGGRSDRAVDREISIHDLTAHPWAGLPVAIHLEAVDESGQLGKSGIVEMALPERIFNHPVARAIIGERKKLVAPNAKVRQEVVGNLAEIARRPAMFFDDTVVFLALSIAQGRLSFGQGTESIASVQRLLWNTALRIEDGEFSIAERDLREAQKKLMEALKGEADNAEVERLMDELQQALNRFLQALRQEMEARGLQELPSGIPLETIQSDELQRMIDEARDLARAGAMEAAREMLARLEEMLDNIQAGLQPGQPRKDIQQAMKLMEGLRSLTEKQQRLLDKTFKRQQRRRDQSGALDNPQSGQDSGKDAGRQQSLRFDLGEIMRQLGDMLGSVPDPLGKAERAMRGAAQALSQDQPGAAVPLQTEALQQLRQAMDSVAETMARRMGGMFGVGDGRFGARPGGNGRDPFGRRQGGAFGSMIDGAIQIPDRMERRRAREILRELRRRAGERQRPRPEREYIQRLLRQF